jgi:hypothetical protein
MDTLPSSVSNRLYHYLTCPGKRPSTGQWTIAFRAAARVRSISLNRKEPATHSDSLLLSDHPRSSGRLIHLGFQFEVPGGIENDVQEDVTFDVVLPRQISSKEGSRFRKIYKQVGGIFRD